MRKTTIAALVEEMYKSLSLSFEEILLQVFRADPCLVGEKSREDGILEGVESGSLPVIEIADCLIISQQTNCDLFEGAPLVDG